MSKIFDEVLSSISAVLSEKAIVLRFDDLLNSDFDQQQGDQILNYFGKAMNHPQMCLSVEGVLYLATILNIIVSRCAKNSDYFTMQRIFNMGSNFGSSSHNVIVKCKQFYSRCENWSNVNFWVHCLHSSLKLVLQCWKNHTENSIQLGELFGSMSSSHVISLLTLCTIQATFTSMRCVGLSSDHIAKFLVRVNQLLPVVECGLDLKVPPSKAFLLRVVNVAGNYVHCERSTDASITRPLSHEAGYSPLVALLLETRWRSASVPLRGGKVRLCITCKEVCDWKVLGGLSGQHLLTREGPEAEINHVLCELCYRHLFAVDPLTADRDSIFLAGVCPTPFTSSPMSDPSFGAIFGGAHSASPRSLDLAAFERAAVCFANANYSSDTTITSSVGGRSHIAVALWRGVGVKVIYAGKPMVEKARLLFLRSSDNKQNADFERLISAATGDRRDSAEALSAVESKLTDAVKGGGFQLCWAHHSSQGALSYSPDKAIPVESVKHIKVGANKWKQCINIASEMKTLVVKVEEEVAFAALLEGLLGLVARTSST